jgi:hypothetical protein
MLAELVYDASAAGIAVGMFERTEGTEQALGFRWVRNGAGHTYFGKDSEWVLLPHDFAVCVARRLIEKKAAGMDGIREEGFRRMMIYLLDEEEIVPNIRY